MLNKLKIGEKETRKGNRNQKAGSRNQEAGNRNQESRTRIQEIRNKIRKRQVMLFLWFPKGFLLCYFFFANLKDRFVSVIVDKCYHIAVLGNPVGTIKFLLIGF